MSDTQQIYRDGNHHLARGDQGAAEQCFLQVLAVDPLHGGARANLAYVKAQQKQYAQADFHYRGALALLPAHPPLLQNFAVLLWKMKRLDEAQEVARQFLALAPDSAAAASLLGVILACAQRESEAELYYRQAIAMDAGYARARFNLAYLLLRQERWNEGWPLLAERWQFDTPDVQLACPQWRGDALMDKSIIIVREAGQGDMIQFCRYAALLKQRGARKVGVICHPSLQRLFASLVGIDQVFAHGDAVTGADWDFWIHPMQLPERCGTTLETLPAAIPYLAAEPALVEYWRPALPSGGMRVGLVWQGNPDFDNDGERSLPALQTLAPLAQLRNVRFISLQVGAAEQPAASEVPHGMALTVLGPQLRDFADTAAILTQLDLLISVDTSTAHLAGALGVPCWLLLPDYCCDWRWLTGRSDTPWYPEIRLFRQPDGQQGWRPVIAQVLSALAVRAQEFE